MACNMRANKTRNYLAVIALLGIAFGALPNLFEFEFQLKVVPHLLNVGDVTSLQTISLIEGILTFLISPPRGSLSVWAGQGPELQERTTWAQS